MVLRLATLVLVCGVVALTAAQQEVLQTAAAATRTAASPLMQLAGTAPMHKRNTKDDNAALATGFTGHHHGHHHHGGHHLGHGHHGHGKFFMYAHQPEHKHYEFGFKRGNDKHVVERYEKGGPHHNFKSKFRWHDHHGGHGERYWDYNHGPHHHDDGGDDDGHHGYSEPVPEFIQPGASHKKESYRQRRKSSDKQLKTDGFYKKPTGMGKKEYVGPKDQQLLSGKPATAANDAALNDMLGFDPFSPPEIMKDHSSVGGIGEETANYPRTSPTPPISKPYFSRKNKKMKKTGKFTPAAAESASSSEVPKLAFDLDSGKVFDEKTGKWFRLVAD